MVSDYLHKSSIKELICIPDGHRVGQPEQYMGSSVWMEGDNFLDWFVSGFVPVVQHLLTNRAVVWAPFSPISLLHKGGKKRKAFTSFVCHRIPPTFCNLWMWGYMALADLEEDLKNLKSEPQLQTLMNALKCRTLGAMSSCHRPSLTAYNAHARILESARANEMITCNGKYTEDKTETKACNRKKLAALHRVVFQVAFRLLLAFLGPLEGSAVEKVRGMALQYPRRTSPVSK